MLSNLILKSFWSYGFDSSLKILGVGKGLPFSVYIRMFHIFIGTVSWEKKYLKKALMEIELHIFHSTVQTRNRTAEN